MVENHVVRTQRAAATYWITHGLRLFVIIRTYAWLRSVCAKSLGGPLTTRAERCYYTWLSAANHHSPFCRTALRQGVEVNQAIEDGTTALYIASQEVKSRPGVDSNMANVVPDMKGGRGVDGALRRPLTGSRR